MILREGHLPIVVAVVSAAGVGVAGGWLASVPLWLLVAWFLRIYRERRPVLPAEPRGVLSPVAGRVSRIVEEDDPFLDRRVLRITVELALPGIVPVRSPTEGKVMELYARCGPLGEPQRACREDESPDCYGQWVRTDEGEDVVFTVSSRLPVSRARFEHAPGERVGQGGRCAFVYFASYADVLAPVTVAPDVSEGEHVIAGETVLAHLQRA